MKRNNEEGLDCGKKRLTGMRNRVFVLRCGTCSPWWRMDLCGVAVPISSIAPRKKPWGMSLRKIFMTFFNKKSFAVQQLIMEGKSDELYLCHACEELYRRTSTWNDMVTWP